MNLQQIQETLHFASALLQYPTEEWRESFPDFRQEAADIEDEIIKSFFLQLLDHLETNNLDDLQQIYVQTFDFGKKTNLYLTYVQYGEERERGPILLQLKKVYEKAGFFLNENELPDYLPAMLEFSAMVTPETSQEVVGPYLGSIQKIGEELSMMNSPYASVLNAILYAFEHMGLKNNG
jgi:nitrate reductase molybdenum cofactor assembly chaperone NarJ/NarW